MRSIVLTRKKLSKIFVEIKYKYDVDTKVLNEIIAHNNDNKSRGNK